MTANAFPIERENHLIEINGVTLHVVQAGPKDGELVILLHGFPEFWYGWRRQIDALAARGFRVWAPDQRGYNLSEKPVGISAYRLDRLAEDVVGLIDAAEHDKAYLAGHDWGGGVAWFTALHHPDRVAKLAILNSPHPAAFTRELQTNVGQRLKSWYFLYFQIPVLPELVIGLGDSFPLAQAVIRTARAGTFTDQDMAVYTKAWRQPGALTAMINWYRSVVQDRPKLPKDIRVKVPTLILWGADDKMLNLQMAQASAALCDEGRLVTFDEATHWVQHEEPHQVSALLAEWFGA